ncbi:hypothetical protein JRQ81_013077 [Phrynocephalus forsythii]|uniref:Uncharacterized protein n=1 Tax=Phrynocephalus forsythii TaxID=171643 RepID=A0A9Q0XZG7_9SAUR|nr:hypothetical protein JRQ81_013077 [Phrynocephalus forsythii]
MEQSVPEKAKPSCFSMAGLATVLTGPASELGTATDEATRAIVGGPHTPGEQNRLASLSGLLWPFRGGSLCRGWDSPPFVSRAGPRATHLCLRQPTTPRRVLVHSLAHGRKLREAVLLFFNPRSPWAKRSVWLTAWRLGGSGLEQVLLLISPLVRLGGRALVWARGCPASLAEDEEEEEDEEGDDTVKDDRHNCPRGETCPHPGAKLWKVLSPDALVQHPFRKEHMTS